MTKKQVKTARALKAYYKYLNARLYIIRLAIIDVPDKEFKRLITVRQFYREAFNADLDFKKWLLEKPHFAIAIEHKSDIRFSALAENLKNKILEWEDNDIRQN